MLPHIRSLRELFVERPGPDRFTQLHDELDIHIGRDQCTLEILDQFIDRCTVNDRFSGEFLQCILERGGKVVKHQASLPRRSSTTLCGIKRHNVLIPLAGAKEHEGFSDGMGDRDCCSTP